MIAKNFDSGLIRNMTKCWPLAFLLLFSCGKNTGSDGNGISTTIYRYGTAALPGRMEALTSGYRPENLSDKTFESSGKTFSPADFISQELELTFDANTKVTTGKSKVTFRMHKNAYPYLDLQASINSATLNGEDISSFHLTNPDGSGQYFIGFNKELEPNTYELILEYTLPAKTVTFTEGGVDFVTSMTDVSNPHFFEVWGPTGFEDDTFSLNLTMKLLNATTPEQLFTNGTIKTHTADQWEIDFPEYFTKSSFYVHLTNTALAVKTFYYKSIPVTVYSVDPAITDEAERQLPGLFEELERDYGPYPHSSFTANLRAGTGGMEYTAAAMTSIPSVDHELLHSWFARGVMPAEGRSGWIDEAIASWRDYGYFQAPTLLERAPTNLSDYSPFKKGTASNCYSDGRQLLAELDRVLAAYGGLKPVLRLFSDRYQHKVVTTEELKKFMESLTMMDLSAYFNRYAFARVSAN